MAEANLLTRHHPSGKAARKFSLTTLLVGSDLPMGKEIAFQ
jgi:hypothetical protein